VVRLPAALKPYITANAKFVQPSTFGKVMDLGTCNYTRLHRQPRGTGSSSRMLSGFGNQQDNSAVSVGLL